MPAAWQDGGLVYKRRIAGSHKPRFVQIRHLSKGAQMEKAAEGESSWMAVVARSLAYLCLKQSGTYENLAEQALFLERLGLSRKDAASLLGSSAASLSVMVGRVTKKKGGTRGSKKKK